MKPIFEAFPISNAEYNELDVKFGSLAHFAAWQLLKKNAKNNHTDELEDIAQELRLSIVRAASYYKRQVYIERCFDLLANWDHDEVEGGQAQDRVVWTALGSDHIGDPFVLKVLQRLRNLWSNRTRHGANKVVFGQPQEELLEHIIQANVPESLRPVKSAPLTIDTKFITYCKAIAWNCQKSMGKKITREKSMRTGMVSLSEFDYLGATA